MINLDKYDICWLAGLLEGEGSFIAASEKNPVCMSVNMTDLDIIEKIAEWWGVCVAKPKVQKNHHKQSYRCMLRGSPAIEWMKILYPYMGLRRKGQIDKALKSHIIKGPHRKVSVEQAREIFERRSNGECPKELAKEFGVTKWTIYAIKQGRVKM